MEGKVIIASTPSELAKLLGQQKVDFYMESTYSTYVINDVQGAGKLLLRRWQRGKPEYQSLIFTKRNSEVNRLDDLRGKIIVFEDPESTSGYFLPKFFLLRNGFKLSEKGRLDASVAPGEIGYIFASSQQKLVDLVLTTQAAGGAFSDDDYAKLDEKTKADVSVLAQSERLPRHLLRSEKIWPRCWPIASKRSCLRCLKTTKAVRYCRKPARPQSSTCCRKGRKGCGEGSWKPFTLPRKNRNLFGSAWTEICRNFQDSFRSP